MEGYAYVAVLREEEEGMTEGEGRKTREEEEREIKKKDAGYVRVTGYKSV